MAQWLHSAYRRHRALLCLSRPSPRACRAFVGAYVSRAVEGVDNQDGAVADQAEHRHKCGRGHEARGCGCRRGASLDLMFCRTVDRSAADIASRADTMHRYARAQESTMRGHTASHE
jgi:hypothetical protein